MGASIQQFVVLLSKDFLKVVIVAFVIAIPLSWYGMNQWPQTFAYGINFSFVVAGCEVVFIALIRISYQSIKAIGNPVDSLRSE